MMQLNTFISNLYLSYIMNDPEAELRGIKMNISFRPETSGRGINQIPIRYAFGINST